jgi:pyridoxine 5-phosphate synthase
MGGRVTDNRNVKTVTVIAEMRELNISHSIIARAIMLGLEQAVRDMKRLVS